ncbi:hypothetical protein COU54_01490 [Candidatus Pacearchaeota archaeon CG10_big_fil_rev_8_21_14_0_10_31_24]|nr:MAG: hypothetical protein COU54_01490 [Candidatus Pacearchaeota archaeon CG10_big_fil_rev_8_21_14_0_10_31_24]
MLKSEKTRLAIQSYKSQARDLSETRGVLETDLKTLAGRVIIPSLNSSLKKSKPFTKYNIDAHSAKFQVLSCEGERVSSDFTLVVELNYEGNRIPHTDDPRELDRVNRVREYLSKKSKPLTKKYGLESIRVKTSSF